MWPCWRRLMPRNPDVHIWTVIFFRFINRESGARGFIKKPASAVVQLDNSNFDSIALDATKDVLVEFYAPCKLPLLLCSFATKYVLQLHFTITNYNYTFLFHVTITYSSASWVMWYQSVRYQFTVGLRHIKSMTSICVFNCVVVNWGQTIFYIQWTQGTLWYCWSHK